MLRANSHICLTGEGTNKRRGVEAKGTTRNKVKGKGRQGAGRRTKTIILVLSPGLDLARGEIRKAYLPIVFT